MKLELPIFREKKGLYFWAFLWEEAGYVGDVVAIAKRLWCKRLLEYSCLVQVFGMTCFGF